jgi:hypothetical protein
LQGLAFEWHTSDSILIERTTPVVWEARKAFQAS